MVVIVNESDRDGSLKIPESAIDFVHSKELDDYQNFHYLLDRLKRYSKSKKDLSICESGLEFLGSCCEAGYWFAKKNYQNDSSLKDFKYNKHVARILSILPEDIENIL
eukprot:Awhi_evm1s4440